MPQPVEGCISMSALCMSASLLTSLLPVTLCSLSSKKMSSMNIVLSEKLGCADRRWYRMDFSSATEVALQLILEAMLADMWTLVSSPTALCSFV